MSEADAGAHGGRSGTQERAPRPQPSKPEADLVARARPSEPQLVLIAEDEEPIAEALSMIVEDAGYAAMIASHGQQALEMARARPPALVLTDLMMPHLDGQELIVALREEARAAGRTPPPIVLMTAAGPRRAGVVGAVAVLRKPFNIADVEAMLHRFLGPPAGERAAPGPDSASGPDRF